MPHFSVSLPARFALRLSSPMALSLDFCRQIAALTNMDSFFDESEAAPLMQIITRNKSGGTLEAANGRGLFVVSTRLTYYKVSSFGRISQDLLEQKPFSCLTGSH